MGVGADFNESYELKGFHLEFHLGGGGGGSNYNYFGGKLSCLGGS